MLRRFLSSKAFGVLLWVALLVQGVAALIAMHPWIAGDSSVYLRLAGSLSHGHYGSDSPFGYVPDPLRPPGYPLLLWLTLYVLRLPIAAVVGLQVAVYLTTIVLIDRFLRNRGINPILFRGLAVIYPFAALYTPFIMAEAWAMILLTAVGLVLARPHLTRRTLAVAGALTGAAALLRTDLLLVPVLISGMALYDRARSKKPLAVSILDSAIPLVLAALIMLPYALWNLSNFGKFTPAPVAAAVGNSLYTATWQGVLSLDDLNALNQGRATAKSISSGLISEIRKLNHSIGAPPMVAPFNPAAYPTVETQIRSNLVFGQAAVERIKRDPMEYGRHVIGNLWWLWNTSRYPAGIPPWLQGFLIGISGLIYVFGIAGVVLVFFRDDNLPYGVRPALIMLYVFVVHLPLHTEARYTAAARPLLLMFASVALASLFVRTRKVAQVRF
jgi:hypothetical protein